MGDTAWIPHVFVICNPTYEAARYNFLRKHLQARGIPEEKIHYVWTLWGHELTSEMIFQIWDPFHNRFGIKHNLSQQSVALSRGELSLMMTFNELLRRVLEGEYSEVIVFESDIVLREDFLPRLKDVLTEAASREWDYISLGEGVGTRPPELMGTSYFTPTKLYKPPYQWVFRCCDSMLLRRGFLEKVKQTFLPCRECLDWEMNVQAMIHRATSWWADPPLAEPSTGRGRYITSLPT
jgi:hypothetical protein